jgi:hypothetical protein
LLSLIALPHRDDVPNIVSRRPDYHDQAVRGEAKGEEAVLAIVPAPVRDRKRRAIENRICIREIKAALRQGAGALILIEADAVIPPGDHQCKLRDKQKKGKTRMREYGSVSIPQEAFIAALRMGRSEAQRPRLRRGLRQQSPI